MVQVIRPEEGPDPLGAAGLGKVPTLGGDITTAVPDPSTGVSSVQTQQSDTTATQAAAQAIVLPPLPYGVIQKLDPSGALTMWLTTLVRKLGGYTSTPLDDAFSAGEQEPMWGDSSEVESLRAQVDGLSELNSDLYAQIDALQALLDQAALDGWTRQPAQAAAAAAAPAGGTGTAAGGWDTAANRDTAIACINNLRTRLATLEAACKAVGITY